MTIVALCFCCAFLILELMIPNVIFLNVAIAVFFSALAIYAGLNIYAIAGIFLLGLIGSIALIRPKVISIEKKHNQVKEIEAKYVGKIFSASEKINSTSGFVTIENERWQARTKNKNETIEEGQNAKIINYKDIVMYVEKI